MKKAGFLKEHPGAVKRQWNALTRVQSPLGAFSSTTFFDCKDMYLFSNIKTMDDKNITKALSDHQKELRQLIDRRLPVIIGRMAKDHFQDNFRKGGFVNGGLNRWPTTQRQRSGSTSAAALYGPLLSGRNHLFSSIKYMPGKASVVIANDVPYAALHNWGGTLHPTVTPRMRRFAWAMFYKESGKDRQTAKRGKKKNESLAMDNPRAERWKAMALTKKKTLTVNVPQRQFIGDSRELSDKAQKRIADEIMKIFQKR